MQYFYRFVLLCTLCAFITTTSLAKEKKGNWETAKQVSGAIDIGNAVISVNTKGTVQIHTPTGKVVVNTDSTKLIENGPTDIYIAPELIQGAGTPMFGQNRALNPFYPAYGMSRNEMLNRLSAYFSTASGGFGFRISFDRRISPQLRALVAPEFLTYSFLRAQQILEQDMPENTTRITLFSLPFGLQHQMSHKSRIVPHIGFGVGPMLRFDHRSPRQGYYPNNGGLRGNAQFSQNGFGVTIPILTEDYPDISLTLGGHVAAGFTFKLGDKKNLGLSVEGRYTVAHFIDELGAPGDFGGLSLGIGFGKQF